MRTISGFTGNLLPSNKDVRPHSLLHIKRYGDIGGWLYSAAGDSVVRRNRNMTRLTKRRRSRSIPHVDPRSARLVSAIFSPHGLQ
jgi:hypothetical protein